MTRMLVVEDDPQLPTRALVINLRARHHGVDAVPDGGRGVAQHDKTNHLRVHTAQLRRRLEKNPSHPHLITERGMGCRFEA